MSEKSTIARHPLAPSAPLRARGEDKTRADAPEAESLGVEFWKSARVRMPAGKTSVALPSTRDIVEWFDSRQRSPDALNASCELYKKRPVRA